MSLDPEQLAAAVRRKNAGAVRELLRGATEAERRACAKALRPLLDGPDLPELEAIELRGPLAMRAEGLADLFAFVMARVTEERDRATPSAADRVLGEWHDLSGSTAFLAASLGLADGVVAAHKAADRYDLWEHPADAALEVIAGVLADRRPPWLAELVSRLLSNPFAYGLSAWPLARALVRLRAIDRPGTPEYTTRMPAALCRRGWAGGGMRITLHPLDALRADPELLDDEVWRLFTVPGAARELEQCDGCWEDALMALSEQGRLDRGRLLDACLDALTMDFAPNRVGWYVAFHDRMNPSLSEMAPRAGRYLRLLAAGAKAGVSLGQGACGRLLAARLLPAEDFLAASGPALLFPQKGVATAQLKLIARVVAAHPPLTDRALAAAAAAFGHQRLDVQEAALGLIARYGLPEEDPERLAIIELAASLAPGLARQTSAAGLPPRPAVPLVEVRSTPPAEFSPAAAPPPLDDPAELIMLLTQLLEDASDTLAVERAVAAAVRLCVLPAAQRARLAAPLISRAQERLRDDHDGPFGGLEIASDIAGLTLAWGTGWSPGREDSWRSFGCEERETVLRSGQARTMAGILTARIREASVLAAGGQPVQLLAEPELESGAISPDQLLGRLKSWTAGGPPRHDLEIAMLRLAPGVDHSFWSAWAALHPASLSAARAAHEQGLARLSLEPEVGPPGHPRRMIGEARLDPVVLARLAGRAAGPDGSLCWALLTALSGPRRAIYDQYGERYYLTPRHQAVVAGWPLLCPWQPELAAAHLLRPLSDSLVPGSTWTGAAATAVRGLSRSGRALGPIGHLALLTGLASAEPYVRIAAAEAWAKAALGGGLEPELAADAIVTGVGGKAFKLSRVADGLEYAAREPAAGRRVVETVFAAVGRLIPAKPANLHLLIELAARTGAVTGLPEPPEVISRTARGSTRLAAAARLLAP